MEPSPSLEAAREAHSLAGQQLAARLWPALRLVGGAFLLALVVRVFLVQPFAIPSRSMSPGLDAGDFVLVDKRAYGWSTASLPLMANLVSADGDSIPRLFANPVKAGDVIAFIGPDGRDYVKRAIALPGDKVAMLNGQLFVNGHEIPCAIEGASDKGLFCRETLANGQTHRIHVDSNGPLAEFPETVVPAGHYFVLGDNRGNSADSRLSRSAGGLGMIADRQVIGKAARIFFSIGDSPRLSRIGRAID